ncbi:phosphotransferase [Bacillus horti]|uniref:Ser/Thr protein kinase RdoA (MazF antagonist) n=1 Tax=Caldalkalibacillus horti TaxID=77523 RepID=A0ABT9VTE4_9BACI|nr:phosphotransferase [Bacillus horti]MDQ0164259.1 Ser/Thr protein kinase RdoA (MazF antagonist) [Bacillus horti]
MVRIKTEQLGNVIHEQFGITVDDVHTHKKNRLYIVHAAGQKYVIKLFSNVEDLKWQSKCIKQLEERQTKGIIPFHDNLQGTSVNKLNDTTAFAMFPYVNGRALDFNIYEELRNGIGLLSHFHQKGQDIYGGKQRTLSKSFAKERIKTRLDLFKESIQGLNRGKKKSSLGLFSLLQRFEEDVTDWADWFFTHLPEYELLQLERQAQQNRQIVHFDLAPHNFLYAEEDSYYLLDYDLIQYSPVILDLSQYIHRSLLHYDWSIDVVHLLLTEYQKELKLSSEEVRLLPYFLLYPHDIIREWLGVWKQQSGFQVRNVIDLFQQLENTWDARRKFVRACQAMVK